MTAQLIDGKSIAREVERALAPDLESLRQRGIIPGLVAVRVGADPASEIYVRNKARKARDLGFAGDELSLPAETSQQQLLDEIDRLNRDECVDGILVQMPLPSHIESRAIIAAIDPAKDVDGFHPINVGRLNLGQRCLEPCTPAGVIRLIESTGETIRGARVAVVGRSDIVGKPVSALLLNRDATVTICHSKTRNLAEVLREADIIVAAIGKPMFIDASMIRPGAIVIDVGINRLDAKSLLRSHLSESKRRSLEKHGSVLVGDVAFEDASEVASWITPVPGGVGPTTIAMLMKNTVQAAMERRT